MTRRKKHKFLHKNLNMLKEDYLKLLYLRQKILTNNFSHYVKSHWGMSPEV